MRGEGTRSKRVLTVPKFKPPGPLTVPSGMVLHIECFLLLRLAIVFPANVY